MDKTKLNLERLRAYDAEWEEDKHPRAENGQFTSGSGSSAGGSSGASGTKKYNQKDLQKLANNYLNYHLGYNETDATADKVEIVSEPDEHGNVDAKVSYDVSVRIPYQETDSDGYTYTTYEEDSEYRTDIISLNISELKPEEPEAPKSPLRQAGETIQGGSGKAAKKADEPAFDFSVEKPANMSKGFFYDVYKPEILSERLHENISKQKYDDVNDYVDSLKSKGFNVSEPEECGYKQYKVHVVYHDDYIGEDVKLITYYRGRSKEAGTPAGGFYR